MTYIHVRREGGRFVARLYIGSVCCGSTAWDCADAALKRAWELWGANIPAFIRPEARP